MLLEILKTHCEQLNWNCICIITGERCPLYDTESEKCLLDTIPYEWNIDKIKKAFDKLRMFDYGSTKGSD